MRVLLVGCSGAGCSTVGGLVAQRLGWPFLDDDAVLERTARAPARTLYDRDGSAALQSARTTALTLLLAVPGPLVASLPSDLLLDAAARERLAAGGHVVWLRASARTLGRRVGRGTGRPWLGDDVPATLARWTAERDPLCAATAHQVADADVVGAASVARAVVAGLPPEALPDRRRAVRS